MPLVSLTSCPSPRFWKVWSMSGCESIGTLIANDVSISNGDLGGVMLRGALEAAMQAPSNSSSQLSWSAWSISPIIFSMKSVVSFLSDSAISRSISFRLRLQIPGGRCQKPGSAHSSSLLSIRSVVRDETFRRVTMHRGLRGRLSAAPLTASRILVYFSATKHGSLLLGWQDRGRSVGQQRQQGLY